MCFPFIDIRHLVSANDMLSLITYVMDTILDESMMAINEAVLSQMEKCGGDWRCTTCGFQTKLRARVWEHVEAKHVETSGYLCPLCQKFCSSKNALKLHKSKYHRNAGNLQF